MFGPGVAVCARPALDLTTPTGTHRHTRDVVSARPIAVAADTALICSAGGTDPELLARLRDSGLPVGTDLRDFRTEAEFSARVIEAIADGLLISPEYPQPALCADEHVLKTNALVGYLNNKASIATLVDPRFQAPRAVVNRAQFADVATVDKSWVLKAATDDAHGASLDVYLHEAGAEITLPPFSDFLAELVIEEYLNIQRNWGIQLYAGPDGRARLLAITEQRVDVTGIYTGGRFGLVSDPPPELVAECVTITQRAADLGYRGLCSLDCVQTRDGRLIVIDLNFRLTGGSVPLLVLRSIRPDALDQPAESVKLTIDGPLGYLLDELRPDLAGEGILIVAAHDTARTDNPVRRSVLQLLLFGDDPDEVTTRRMALEGRITPTF